jgi:hypothetical protein
MHIFKHKTSKIIPLAIALILPFSFALAIGYDVYLNNLLLDEDLTVEELKAYQEHKTVLPLVQLITFGTVVIPAIMVRKAVREGTHNTFVRTDATGNATIEETPVESTEELIEESEG